MKTVVLCIVASLLIAASAAAAEQEPPPAEVMLFGVFHFANPGHDLVKTDQVNVMTEGNQEYLEALARKISQFNPTVVLLEYDPARDDEMDERFQRYVAGDYELPANEVYQLGFRIAALSDAAAVHGFDESNVQWEAEPLFAYMESHDTETGGRMSALIERITRESQHAQTTLSLRELLLRANDPEQDALNRATYLLTNAVGTTGNFVGADATASWWHRNFRMYAHVQRYARPGERVLVIGGQGHIAILRQFLADDLDRQPADVRAYLN